MNGQSLYVHIPFCQAKCAYCDFCSYAGLESLFDCYTAALIQELEQYAPAPIRTIYIGGGTPTVLPLSHLAWILNTTRQIFDLDPGAEVTIEANPGTVDASLLAELLALGANRLSLGVQSLDDHELALLGRIHTADQAIESVLAARQAGIGNLSLDLIFGLPRQSTDTWSRTLDRALALEPEHLSLYALSIEDGTPLASAIERGDLPAPDPDLAATMYEAARDTLARAGYLHYEISNWAKSPAYRCRHNLTYWRNESYLGVGAGAHSWQDGRRRSNLSSVQEYTERILGGETATTSEESIDTLLDMAETMMMGLRLLEEGVSFNRFRERFGLDLREHYAHQLEELVNLDLVHVGDGRVQLTRQGQLLGNQAFYRFLPDPPGT